MAIKRRRKAVVMRCSASRKRVKKAMPYENAKEKLEEKGGVALVNLAPLGIDIKCKTQPMRRKKAEENA